MLPSYRVRLRHALWPALILTLTLPAFGRGDAKGEAGPAAPPRGAQRTADPLSHVFGDVLSIDPAAGRVLLKTEDGREVAALFNDKTDFLRVLPGQTNLSGAERVTLADIAVGDKVMARGRESADKSSVAARQLIVMSKAAIVSRQERDREEWRRRGVSGRVAELNPGTKEIKLAAPSANGTGSLTLVATEKTVFRRYAPGSVKFSDAAPSAFAELKVGDQLRALGEKSADGTRFTPEEVVSGSFRMVGGPVTALNAEAGEITIKNIPTGQPLTIVVSKDSLLRRIPPEVIASLASKKAGGEVQEAFAGFPSVTVADLKVGEMILANAAAGAGESKVTAVLLATGVGPLFAQPQQPRPNRALQNIGVGLPAGVLDGIIVVQ